VLIALFFMPTAQTVLELHIQLGSVLGDRAEYHPRKHGELPPDVTGKNVVILDFSFKNDSY
jgi:hypothetical protein